MIISFGGKEYVSGESYAAEDILAAYKQGLRNGKWEEEEKHKSEVAVEPQYHYDKGYEDGKSFGINLGKDGTVFQKQWVDKERKSAYDRGYHEGYKVCDEEKEDSFKSGYNQGCNDANEGLELRKDVLNKEYVKGKTDGYNEGYQHGFTIAKEKIPELDKDALQSQYNKGFEKGSDYANEYIKQDKAQQNSREEEIQKLSFNDGYQSGKKDGLEKGFDKGYNTAIKEMSNNQALGETTDYEFGTDDCCEHHTPNKETQEAMQEVVDKISYKGVWASNENNPNWEIEYHSDCGAYLWVKIIKKPDMALGYTVGQLFTISKSALREGYSKKYVGDVNSKVEGEQLEKELVLVEKYPHYYKDIRHLNIIDIYRFFDLFEVTDPCIQHSMKKLAVGGKRGAKDYEKDIKEAMDTLKRWEYMKEENKRGLDD